MLKLRSWLIVLPLALMIVPLLTTAQDANPTPFISGNSASLSASISADGRFIAFASDATNLVPDDTNEMTDVFVHDRETGETTRVSVASDGSQAAGYSRQPAISGDGRFIAYESEAKNLVADDTNNWADIFVYDRETGETTRVSVTSDGVEGDLASLEAAISADGRFVAFWSNAGNLVPEDENTFRDAFVHDRETGETVRVSVASDGTESNEDTYNVAISGDGQTVAFWSRASNLVEGDTNGMEDIFIHDLTTRTTTRVNVSADGQEANGYTFDPVSISADGQWVAFQSQATNLTDVDTKGRNEVFVYSRASGQVERVALAAGGVEPTCTDHCAGSSDPALSADGRFVVFRSDLTGLIEGDTNDQTDVFLYDRETQTPTRISVNNAGGELDVLSNAPDISADGLFIVYETSAALVPTDLNFTTDVYLYDREAGTASPVAVVTPR